MAPRGRPALCWGPVQAMWWNPAMLMGLNAAITRLDQTQVSHGGAFTSCFSHSFQSKPEGWLLAHLWSICKSVLPLESCLQRAFNQVVSRISLAQVILPPDCTMATPQPVRDCDCSNQFVLMMQWPYLGIDSECSIFVQNIDHLKQNWSENLLPSLLGTDWSSSHTRQSPEWFKLRDGAHISHSQPE